MDELSAWNDFNVAMVGATAALAGLVIVASSVNIAEIIKTATITARLAAGIASLVLAIAVSGLQLMPGVTTGWLSAGMLTAAVAAGAFQVHAAVVIVGDRSPQSHARGAKAALGFIPVVTYALAAVLVLVDSPAALYVAAAASMTTIAAAIVVSWVALVEVLR